MREIELSATEKDCLKQAGFWWSVLVQASLEGDRHKMREASYWLAYSSSKIADDIAEADDEDEDEIDEPTSEPFRSRR